MVVSPDHSELGSHFTKCVLTSAQEDIFACLRFATNREPVMIERDNV